MSQETLLKNARLVLEDEVVTGSVLLRDGLIADVGGASEAPGDDMDGDYLLPGLVELHTDHLEGHYAPRPKVRWNPFAAVQAHDAQIACSAITTVFDALGVGNTDGDHDLVTDDMVVLAEAIQSGMATGRLRADHFLHLRFGCLAIADHSLFQLQRGVLGHRQVVGHQRGQAGTTRLAQQQRGLRVDIDEHDLAGRHLGLVARHHLGDAIEQDLEPLGQQGAVLGTCLDGAARHVLQVRAVGVDHAEAGALQSGVDAEDSHRLNVQRTE